MPSSRGMEALNPVSDLCLLHLPALAGGFFTTGTTCTLPHKWFDFTISAILAFIVMHDAMGVRLETSKQAVVINQMVDLIRNMGKKIDLEEKLKEFVGHTPIQVVAGSLLGILVGVLVNMQ